jgi:DNA repair protein RecO (recombination protein O)
MLHKTQGVVLRFTRYRETSIITSIFTEHFGLQSYIVNGIRQASAGGKIALYQPLTLLDMVVYYRETAHINRIREIRCLYPYETLYRDIRKSAIALFIAEVLNKTIREESNSAEMFDFIQKSMVTLDQLHHGYENFHLLFLIGLSRKLGFGIQTTEDVFQHRPASEQTIEALKTLLKSGLRDDTMLSLQQRREILSGLLHFYQSHIESLGEFRSVPVLQEVLS